MCLYRPMRNAATCTLYFYLEDTVCRNTTENNGVSFQIYWKSITCPSFPSTLHTGIPSFRPGFSTANFLFCFLKALYRHYSWRTHFNCIVLYPQLCSRSKLKCVRCSQYQRFVSLKTGGKTGRNKMTLWIFLFPRCPLDCLSYLH